MENVNKQLLDAAKQAKHALDLYKAYGWADRNDVIGKLESSIAAAEQAEQAEPANQQRAGVYRKFNVSRTDGRDLPGGDRHGAEYFVLDVTHDKFAKPALAAYAAACRNDYPALADDMVRRYGIAQQQAEPVAWEVRNGVVTHNFYKTAEDAEEVARDMQKSHDLSGSIAAFNVRAVYAQPPAVADPVARDELFNTLNFERGSRVDLQRDAERYRWLLQQAWFQDACYRYDLEDGGRQNKFEELLGITIDQAMRNQ